MIDLTTVCAKYQSFVGLATEELLKYFAEKKCDEIKLDLDEWFFLFDSDINVQGIGVDVKKLGESIGCGYDFIGLSYFYAIGDDGVKHRLDKLALSDVLRVLASVIDYETYMLKNRKFIDQTIHFDNESVLITDPCYFLKINDPSLPDVDSDDYDLISKNGWDRHNLTVRQAYDHVLSIKQYNEIMDRLYDERRKNNDILAVDHGRNLGALGFSNYIARETGYGDWSCAVFEECTNKKLGDFCADSGMVCVISLKQVLDYNPEFANKLKETPYIATVLENFTGDITYKVDATKKPDGEVADYNVYLVGEGSVNFKSEQIGC